MRRAERGRVEGKEEEVKEEGREDKGEKEYVESKMSEWGEERTKKEVIYYKVRERETGKNLTDFVTGKKRNSFCRREKEMAFENRKH